MRSGAGLDGLSLTFCLECLWMLVCGVMWGRQIGLLAAYIGVLTVHCLVVVSLSCPAISWQLNWFFGYRYSFLCAFYF